MSDEYIEHMDGPLEGTKFYFNDDVNEDWYESKIMDLEDLLADAAFSYMMSTPPSDKLLNWWNDSDSIEDYLRNISIDELIGYVTLLSGESEKANFSKRHIDVVYYFYIPELFVKYVEADTGVAFRGLVYCKLEEAALRILREHLRGK